jgi:hypothetical protein
VRRIGVEIKPAKIGKRRCLQVVGCGRHSKQPTSAAKRQPPRA